MEFTIIVYIISVRNRRRKYSQALKNIQHVIRFPSYCTRYSRTSNNLFPSIKECWKYSKLNRRGMVYSKIQHAESNTTQRHICNILHMCCKSVWETYGKYVCFYIKYRKCISPANTHTLYKIGIFLNNTRRTMIGLYQACIPWKLVHECDV